MPKSYLGGNLQVVSRTWGTMDTHSQLPIVVRRVEVGVRRAAKGEGRKGC